MSDQPAKPHWLVRCSCGWTTTLSAEWAAQSAAKIHASWWTKRASTGVRGGVWRTWKGARPAFALGGPGRRALIGEFRILPENVKAYPLGRSPDPPWPLRPSSLHPPAPSRMRTPMLTSGTPSASGKRSPGVSTVGARARGNGSPRRARYPRGGSVRRRVRGGGAVSVPELRCPRPSALRRGCEPGRPSTSRSSAGHSRPARRLHMGPGVVGVVERGGASIRTPASDRRTGSSATPTQSCVAPGRAPAALRAAEALQFEPLDDEAITARITALRMASPRSSRSPSRPRPFTPGERAGRSSGGWPSRRPRDDFAEYVDELTGTTRAGRWGCGGPVGAPVAYRSAGERRQAPARPAPKRGTAAAHDDAVAFRLEEHPQSRGARPGSHQAAEVAVMRCVFPPALTSARRRTLGS